MKLLRKMLAGLLLSTLLVVFLPLMAMANDGYPSIANGGSHYLAIKTDGTLWAWGDNRYGQLGDGTTENKTEPVMVMEDVSAVAAGFRHTLAIKTDGSLWAWGDGQYGQLGNGTTAESSTPIQVMADAAVVVAGVNHSFVIKTDGTLWAWGFNTNGQLGDGTSVKKAKPVKILDNVAFVTSGTYNTLAIKADGTLWAWGDNKYGQIGDGTTAKNTTPVQVLDDVVFATAGNDHTLGIKTDHTLWAWGDNEYGQIGDGTNKARLTPVQVLSDVESAVEGLAIKTDGSLWAWGFNYFDRPSDGSIYSPSKVMDDVANVSTTMLIKMDGSVWFCLAKSATNVMNPEVNGRFMGKTVLERKLSNVAAMATANTKAGPNNLAVKQDGTLWFLGYAITNYRQYNPYRNDALVKFHSNTVEYTVEQFAPQMVLDDVRLPQPHQLYIPAPTPEPEPEPMPEVGQLPMTGLESASSWAWGNLEEAIAEHLVPLALQGDYTQNITRAEFCALTVAYIEATANTPVADYLRGQGITLTENVFSDTTDINVAYAYALDIVSGMGEGLFVPTGQITREQAAAMLTRLQAALGADTNVALPAQFGDSGQISSWAKASVDYVYAQGIMGGIGGNNFDPQGKFTREQAIVTFLRIFENH